MQNEVLRIRWKNPVKLAFSILRSLSILAAGLVLLLALLEHSTVEERKQVDRIFSKKGR
jgi:hypothetical protein